MKSHIMPDCLCLGPLSSIWVTREFTSIVVILLQKAALCWSEGNELAHDQMNTTADLVQEWASGIEAHKALHTHRLR